MSNYDILIPELTLIKVRDYLDSLLSGRKVAGARLNSELNETITLSNISDIEFVRLLLGTKLPQIYAESAVLGDGSDWTLDELSILGDIGVSSSVTVFDNGLHHDPIVHQTPFKATLMFIPGALLRSDRGIPADWDEVTQYDALNEKAYIQLYERRLLPLLAHANKLSESLGKQAFITIPGLGCGQFAGPFRGSLGNLMKMALIEILERHRDMFPAIKAIYFDPYSECANGRVEIGNISFRTRPLTKGNQGKAQLCALVEYEEPEDDFGDCILFSVVAWDHVSWPGNDFYVGSRATDDGVKAAATSVMSCMTGVSGLYDAVSHRYNPPSGFSTWEQVVFAKRLKFGQTADVYVY